MLYSLFKNNQFLILIILFFYIKKIFSIIKFEMDGYNRENFYKSKNSGLYLSKSLMKPFKDFINTEGKTKEQRASLEISLLDILLFDSDD